MRSILLCLTAVAGLMPYVAVAQVLQDIDSVVASVTDDSRNSIVILGITANTGSVDGSVTILATGGFAGSQTSETIQKNSESGSTVTPTSTPEGSNITFGDISTLSAGAVNDVSINLDLYEGATRSENRQLTGTMLPAAAGTDRSYSVEGFTLSSNEASVSGAVTVVTNSSQSEIGGINTTTVGSMNNSSVTVYIGR